MDPPSCLSIDTHAPLMPPSCTTTVLPPTSIAHGPTTIAQQFTSLLPQALVPFECSALQVTTSTLVAPSQPPITFTAVTLPPPTSSSLGFVTAPTGTTLDAQLASHISSPSQTPSAFWLQQNPNGSYTLVPHPWVRGSVALPMLPAAVHNSFLPLCTSPLAVGGSVAQSFPCCPNTASGLNPNTVLSHGDSSQLLCLNVDTYVSSLTHNDKHTNASGDNALVKDSQPTTRPAP